MPTLIVTDANILIDLALTENHRLLLLPEWSAVTTVDVFNELRPEQQASWKPYVDEGLFTLEEVKDTLVEEIRAEVTRALSDEDCTVLVLAEQHAAIILSGDQPLVKAYRNRGREAHGILWLLDQNESFTRYSDAELHACLRAIMAVNTWLPMAECKKRLDRWGVNP